MMNTSEIVDRYDRKHTSIQVLAELNDVTEKEIRTILKDAGVLKKVKLPERVAAASKQQIKEIEKDISEIQQIIDNEKEELENIVIQKQTAINNNVAAVEDLKRELNDIQYFLNQFS